MEIEIDKLAHLARLRVEADEKAALMEQLQAMVAFAGQLSAIDTEGVPPAGHPLPPQNVLRADVVTQGLSREALLQNAPDTEDGFIRVPRAVE